MPWHTTSPPLPTACRNSAFGFANTAVVKDAGEARLAGDLVTQPAAACDERRSTRRPSSAPG